MKINEVRYKNIEIRKFSETKNIPIDINNNSTLTSVSGKEVNMNVNFVFTANYEPNIGVIRIEGDLKVTGSEDNIKNALDEWEGSGSKNLPQDVAEEVHNAILANCIVEATILSREVQLPAPIPTPRVSINKKQGEKTKEENRKDKENYEVGEDVSYIR